MPATSKKQQMAAGAALAAKRGKRSKSSLKGASKQMEKSMSAKQLEDFAKTKRNRLPKRRG
jgi:Protein of unknwon function (DUF3008)